MAWAIVGLLALVNIILFIMLKEEEARANNLNLLNKIYIRERVEIQKRVDKLLMEKYEQEELIDSMMKDLEKRKCKCTK